MKLSNMANIKLKSSHWLRIHGGRVEYRAADTNQGRRGSTLQCKAF